VCPALASRPPKQAAKDLSDQGGDDSGAEREMEELMSGSKRVSGQKHTDLSLQQDTWADVLQTEDNVAGIGRSEGRRACCGEFKPLCPTAAAAAAAASSEAVFKPLPPPRIRLEPVRVEFTKLETPHLPARCLPASKGSD